jgi:benzoyl-CoA reductase subunit A
MTTIDCAIGIDLGSTTTKAVMIDTQGRVLGRGITNSRSNYDVACAVARNEALVDARVGLVRRALEERAAGVLVSDDVLAALDRGYRVAKHRRALERLRAVLQAEAGSPRHAAFQPQLSRALDEVMSAVDEEAAALFAPGAPRRSDFFRDIASSQFMAHAERLPDRRTLPYEVLLGLFDKTILIVENEVLDVAFESLAEGGLVADLRARGVPPEACALAASVVHDALRAELRERCSVGTGYGRARLPFPKENIRSEILCHGLGAHEMFPASRTVLDIGGQDTKAIQVDENGIVTSFQMNDRCAAGCGRYLGYIADEMNMGVHELGPLAMKATRQVKINSTCTVFAGAELRDRLNLGQAREDILGGLHRAIMLRAMSLLARSGGVREELTFTGGVARNPAAVRALVQLVEENYGTRTLNISPESIYTGALGAALFALRAHRGIAAPTLETRPRRGAREAAACH